MDIIKFDNIAFYVEPNRIRGVRDISISVSSETEENTQDDEKYVKRKNASPYQASMKAILMAALGVPVQSTAIELTEAARNGRTGYLYSAGAKIFPCKFMMTGASIGNLQISSKGVWTYCEVSLTFQQCSKYDGSTSGSSSTPSNYGGGGGGSNSGQKTKKKSTKSKSAKEDFPKPSDTPLFKSELSAPSDVIAAAKAAASTVKTTTGFWSSVGQKIKAVTKKTGNGGR